MPLTPCYQNLRNYLLPGTGSTRSFFSRATRSFRRVSARGRHVFGRRPKKRAAKPQEENLLRLDVCRSQANRKLKVARLDFFRGIPPKFEP